MTDAIRSNRPHSSQIDSEPSAQTGAAARTAASTTQSAHRGQSTPARPRDDFGHAATRDRRLDRALGPSHATTPAETTIQQRLSLDSRRLGNLGSLIARMETTQMGPSAETHRNDVPFAPPLDEAIREQQGELLADHLREHAQSELMEHGAIQAGEHAAAHFGAERLATGLGVAGEAVNVLSGGIMQAQFTAHALEAGDNRAAAAVARQTWENHQGSIDGQIAQSRADGRNAMRAADVANTSEPVTIDWNRFQTDGDYAHSALTEARSQMRSTQTRMQSDRALLSNAQQMSPQVQAMFPWLVGGPQS